MMAGGEPKWQHSSGFINQEFRWLLAGAVAGVAVDLSLYPLDTVKTRIQSKSGFWTSGGFRQIYRGIPAVALGSAPGSALFFLTYSNSREFIGRLLSSRGVSAPVIDAISATFGEIAACLARVPTEIVKQRAQTTQNSRIGEISKEIYANAGGLRGFYKGYTTTVCREIPFSFIQYPLWEWFKHQWRAASGGHEPTTPLESATCGSLAGLIAAAITTPLDVLKTRVMLDRSKQTRLFPLAVEIIRTQGILRLYSGVLPRSLWMCLGGFIYFFSYEFTMRATK